MNKLSSPPVLEDDAEDELIQLAVEQKQAFDAALSHRDELVKRLVVPRHRAPTRWLIFTPNSPTWTATVSLKKWKCSLGSSSSDHARDLRRRT